MSRTGEQLNSGEVITVEELDQIPNNSIIYKDNNGSYQDTPLGADGTVLKSNGGTVAPSFSLGGTGDMLASDYDNTLKKVNVYDQDNMDDGTVNKNFTAIEQTNLSNQSGTNTGDQDLSGLIPKTTNIDTAIMRANGTTGDLEDSGVTIDDEDTIENTRGIKLDIVNTPTITSEGTVFWNNKEYTINVETGLGATLQVGQETLVLFYNDTGITIPNGSILHPISGTMVGGIVVITVELAKADKFETCQGTLFTSTFDVLDSTLGFGTKFGKVRDVDTLAFGAGAQLWLSADNAGEFVNIQPQFPNYVLSMGGTLNADDTNGIIFINQTTRIEDTFMNAWDGAIRESFTFTETSDGATITGSLVNSDLTNDLTVIFSDGFFRLDVTPTLTIELVPGTDDNPQSNYVYIPVDTKVLTVSTTEFPETEHAKISFVVLRSSVTTQTDGALRNNNWNDHIKKDNNNGHILHMAERLRQLPAKWDSGTFGSSIVNGESDVDVASTSGVVYQLHKQVFPAKDTALGADLHMVNDFVAPYKTVMNLGLEITDALGVSLANSSFSFVLWGVQNKTGVNSHMMINLPTGSYSKNVPDNAVDDSNNYSVYDIPSQFEGAGFLIARFTYVLQANGTTWSLYSTQDLRGKIPNTTAGGGGGGIGVTEWTALNDTPAALVTNKFSTVNIGATSLELVKEVPTGVVVGTTDIQTLTNKTLTSPIVTTAINAQVGTTYTLLLTDQSKLVTLTNAAAIALTIPTNASVAFPIGTQVDLSQDGAGAVTISGAGVTINSKGAALTTNGQYVGVSLIKVGIDEWNVYGDLV